MTTPRPCFALHLDGPPLAVSQDASVNLCRSQLNQANDLHVDAGNALFATHDAVVIVPVRIEQLRVSFDGLGGDALPRGAG